MDESDIDEHIGESSDEDEARDEELVTPEKPFDMQPMDNDADSDSSDDNVPLINLVRSSRRAWKTGDLEPLAIQRDDNQDEENLGEIRSPFDYFIHYLDEEFFVDVANCTNMREVFITGKSLGTSAEEIKTYFACSLVIGIYNLPRLDMFWQSSSRVPFVSDNISRNRFYALRTKLKLVDDNTITQKQKEIDRFWKVRPMLDKIQKACRENKRSQHISIDEQMIPFHGKVSMKQYVRGKPNPVGLKNFVMTTPKGIPLDFYLYEGKGSSTESSLVETPEKLNVGGRMVLKLTDTLPLGVSVYTDRYFTSITLIETLSLRSITLAGTIMANRIPKDINLKKDNELKRTGRGSYDVLVSHDKNICVVKWYDSKAIHFASSACGAEPHDLCKRWSKADNKYIEIKRPAVVKLYNENMGGIDLLDRVIAKYAMNSRTKKWTIRTIHHFFDFCVAASWLQYREDAIKRNLRRREIMDYYAFKFALARMLLLSGDNSASSHSDNESDDEPRPKKKCIVPVPDRSFRKKESKHMPLHMSDSQKSRSKCRYPGCNKLTFVKCTKCDVFLCFCSDRNCFSQFHK